MPSGKTTKLPGRSGVKYMVDREFWRGKKVFVTGHTGFKGAWLSIWLNQMGAGVTGYALEAPTIPSLFDLTHLGRHIHSIIGDIRDRNKLVSAMKESKAEFIFHLAAQPLVIESYANPAETYETNVLGTVNVLESVRLTPTVRAAIMVTTDKCYENREWLWGYRENDRLGGFDPYSSSKACAELAIASYRNSFFPSNEFSKHGVGIASARAGNVIGGGDFAKNRLIPDCLRALQVNEEVQVRRPGSIRPWQHVLEALSGYLLLAQKLSVEGVKFADAWNFGPDETDAKPVSWILDKIKSLSSDKLKVKVEGNHPLHEAGYLKLDTSKARTLLGWAPKWKLDCALRKVMEWHHAFATDADLWAATTHQIDQYHQDCG